ncbi:MAG: hypothetical protein DRG36_03705 [Deltaproteobacteria bacterium]|nr:MAG: hypothetical protein DRG36_03705 [Deltaproteobacteria bacterium]
MLEEPYTEDAPGGLTFLRALSRGLLALVEGYLRQQEAKRQRRWAERMRREDWRNRLLERMMPSLEDLYSMARREERRRRWSVLRGTLSQIFTPYYEKL